MNGGLDLQLCHRLLPHFDTCVSLMHRLVPLKACVLVFDSALLVSASGVLGATAFTTFRTLHFGWGFFLV